MFANAPLTRRYRAGPAEPQPVGNPRPRGGLLLSCQMNAAETDQPPARPALWHIEGLRASVQATADALATGSASLRPALSAELLDDLLAELQELGVVLLTVRAELGDI